MSFIIVWIDMDVATLLLFVSIFADKKVDEKISNLVIAVLLFVNAFLV